MESIRSSGCRGDRGPRRKQALGLPEHVPLIGSLGRLDHAKGYRYLIEALPELLRHFSRRAD